MIIAQVTHQGGPCLSKKCDHDSENISWSLFLKGIYFNLTLYSCSKPCLICIRLEKSRQPVFLFSGNQSLTEEINVISDIWGINRLAFRDDNNRSVLDGL